MEAKKENSEGTSFKRELPKLEDKIEIQEIEKTKKKKKKVKEDIFKTNILESTPKEDRSFSFANLHSCFSPLIFSSLKKEDR